METKDVELDIGANAIVSIDGIVDFTRREGHFYKYYGKDAAPLVEWGERMAVWLAELRAAFGERLKHIAIRSKYKEGQFPIPHLCADDRFRELTIDNPRMAVLADKFEPDATASQSVIREIRKGLNIVLAGVTTTTCVDATVGAITEKIRAGLLPVFSIVIARDGVASRKSRLKKHHEILDRLAGESRITVVPSIANIRWLLPK